MNMMYKLILTAAIIAIGAMTLLAGSINNKEAQRIALATAPIVQEAIQHKNEEWEKYYQIGRAHV